MSIHTYGRLNPNKISVVIPEPEYLKHTIHNYTDTYNFTDKQLKEMFVNEISRICHLFNHGLLPKIIKFIHKTFTTFHYQQHKSLKLQALIKNAIDNDDYSEFFISSSDFNYEMKFTERQMACFRATRFDFQANKVKNANSMVELKKILNHHHHMNFFFSALHYRIDFNNFIFDTLRHEFAHAVVYIYFEGLMTAVTGKNNSLKPHCKEWKYITEYLGGKPKASHKYEGNINTTVAKRDIINYYNHLSVNGNIKIPKAKKQKTFLYACACSEHYLTTIRHNKIIKGSQGYICKSCKQKLVYKNQK